MSTRKTLWIKLIPVFLGWALFILLSYFFGLEYQRHYTNHSQYISQQNSSDEKIQNFSLSQLEYIPETSLITTPNLTWLDDIVGMIDVAESEIYIEVYLLTEKRISQAIIRAHQRWVDVKIIVEKNPYKAYNINNKQFKLLQEAGVNIVWSHVENYSLNHSKLILIDGAVLVSTGNLSYSTFSKNRDFFVMIDDIHIYRLLREIFLNDFTGVLGSPYHSNILLSPESSRKKIETLIGSAQTSLDIYMQYLQDESMEELIIQKAQQWVNISAILPKNYFSNENNQDQIKTLTQAWIQLTELSPESMHAKAILVDESFLYIGSINMSSYSLDNNREIWLILKDIHIIQSFLQQYRQDLKRGLQKPE